MASEFEERPWGGYRVVDAGPGFQVKRLVVRPRRRLSYQRHQHRAEDWLVVAGTGVATLDGRDVPLAVQSRVTVPIGCAHRVRNDGADDLVIIEVQTGDYFGEDDIERLADDYGRVADPAADRTADRALTP